MAIFDLLVIPASYRLEAGVISSAPTPDIALRSCTPRHARQGHQMPGLAARKRRLAARTQTLRDRTRKHSLPPCACPIPYPHLGKDLSFDCYYGTATAPVRSAHRSRGHERWRPLGRIFAVHGVYVAFSPSLRSSDGAFHCRRRVADLENWHPPKIDYPANHPKPIG